MIAATTLSVTGKATALITLATSSKPAESPNRMLSAAFARSLSSPWDNPPEPARSRKLADGEAISLVGVVLKIVLGMPKISLSLSIESTWICFIPNEVD